MKRAKAKLGYVPFDGFKDGWREFIRPMRGFAELHALTKMSASISNICSMPLLNTEQERYLFRQYNALKYRASKTVSYEWRMKLLASAQEVKDVLVLCNVRLGVNLLKKWQLTSPAERFDFYFSECCEYLCYAVDKFDFSRGFKFSTYATIAMTRNLGRLCKNISRDADRISFFPNSDLQRVYDDDTVLINETKCMVRHLMSGLNRRVVDCIMSSFSGESLCMIAKRHGISEERVRQLKNAGLQKMREKFFLECDDIAIGVKVNYPVNHPSHKGMGL